MKPNLRALVALVVAVAVCWHVLAVLSPGWTTVAQAPGKARDFTSYYYAVHVAAQGGDPWVYAGKLANSGVDTGRVVMHPFLYPPPFLLIMAWALPLDVSTAYPVWFWLDELWALVAFVALWRWWRPLGSSVAVTLAVVIAANTAIPANHVMGQANFPGLTFAILALWADDRRRPWLAGALMGAACMVKMSPALFVMWWLLRRNWAPVAVACLTAVALSVAALPLVSAEHQLGFYQRVLPSFGSGDYNGLSVPIEMFGNHSIPNLWHQLLPSGGRLLSPRAEWASGASTVVLAAALGWAFRRPGADLMQRGAQASAIGVVLLLLPVYTYEHHTVWALPAVVIAIVAVVKGRLSPGWAPLIALAAVLWCWEIMDLRRAEMVLRQAQPWVALAVQEAKFVALLVFLAATTWLGARVPAAAEESALELPQQPQAAPAAVVA